jgi:hypothetical protein
MLILASAPSAASVFFGRFSGALLLSTAIGPSVGRLIDRQGGRGLLAASNLVIATGLPILAAAWLLINASQTSRCARSELNSDRGPPRRICGCRPHSEPLYSAECCCRLTASSAGVGADQSTCPLGQAKEPRARPMRSGNPFGNHRQRAIMPAVIFEPVLTNQHSVGVSAPLAH